MNISLRIEESWKEVLKHEFEKNYILELKKFLLLEKKKYDIFPRGSDIFKAFNLTPFHQVKVVILGQDPYHGKGQANRLSFSVPNQTKQPPSLINIFNEIESDLKINNQRKGDLTAWALQGVLLLNSTLTVRANQAGSHQNKGWERLTDKVISLLSEKKDGIIFLLWGKFAQNKSQLIDQTKHHILQTSHPSPLAAYRGFLGSKHFSKCNDLLKSQKLTEINWQIL